MSDYIIGGIFQGDLIIATGIKEGLRLLREDSWQLDYIFSSLVNDPIASQNGFGLEEIKNAREWFLKTNVNVTMGYIPEPPEFPAISITIKDDSEAENTLGDINYETQVDSGGWENLTIKFSAIDYDYQTGVLTIPLGIVQSLAVLPGMYVVLSNGHYYKIKSLQSVNQLVIDSVNDDFTEIVLRGANPSLGTKIESNFEKQTYVIGAHAKGPATYCIYLTSILKYIILRYKQDLFEARGFERTSYSSTPFMPDGDMPTEMSYQRFINFTGYIRNDWPKYTGYKNVGTTAQMQVVGTNQVTGLDEVLAIIGDQDTLGGDFSKQFKNSIVLKVKK